jgi:hypothetical protein
MNRRTTGHVPSKEIFHLNIYLVGAFTLVSVVVMAGAAGSGAFSAFGVWLYNTLRRFIRWLVSLLPKAAGEGLPDEQEQAPFAEDMGGFPYDNAAPVDNLFLQILERIIISLVTITFYALIAAALWGLFVLIRDAFRRRAGKAKTDGGEGDIVEKIERPVRKTKEKRPRRIFGSADERIRRIFARAVERRYNERTGGDLSYILLHSGTARELLALFDGEPEPARTLIALYEKARYARESCTAADVREARRLARMV